MSRLQILEFRMAEMDRPFTEFDPEELASKAVAALAEVWELLPESVAKSLLEVAAALRSKALDNIEVEIVAANRARRLWNEARPEIFH